MSSLGRKLKRSHKGDFVSRQAGFKALEERIKSQTGAQEIAVLHNVPGQMKLSEALTALIQPYVVPGETMQMRRALLTMAVLAWNATLVDEEAFLDMLAATTGAMPADEQTVSIMLVGALSERKRKMFPDDNRYIVDFELQDFGASYHLVVAGAPIAANLSTQANSDTPGNGPE